MPTLLETIQRVTRTCRRDDDPATIGLHQLPGGTWQLRGRTRAGHDWSADVSEADSRAQAEREAEAYLRRTYLDPNPPAEDPAEPKARAEVAKE